jgi:hypothetical protein
MRRSCATELVTTRYERWLTRNGADRALLSESNDWPPHLAAPSPAGLFHFSRSTLFRDAD